ncbi:hypothetical protein QBC37DRAFT_376616 [Rhypophila decipiens]|uniref:Uncharacterized protein n=1 Tax=Rhypophila decipiens TaxID=261697 RepID=A0AAN7B7F6_9PEZI|nr:hypothetical protein QBC37DRAFT_376616 [Rhypophila decipiens]
MAHPFLAPLEYNVDEAVLTNIRLLLRSSKTKPRDDFTIKDGKLHIRTDQSCHVSFICPISKADDLYSTDARPPRMERPIIGGDRYIYQVRAFVALRETSWDEPIWVLCGNRERDSHDQSQIPWCKIIDENTMAEIGLIAGKDTASGPVGKHMWPTKAQFEKDIWENRKAWECLLGFITNHEGANEKSQSRQTRSYSEGDLELKRTTDITATVIAKTFLGVPATVLEVLAVKREVEFVD